MFKKFLAGLLVALMLMMSCVGVHASSSDQAVFEPLMIPLFDKTATGWFSTSTNRALFAATMAIEIIDDEREAMGNVVTEAIISGDVYVSMDADGDLQVYYWSDSAYVLAIYAPSIETVICAMGYGSVSSTSGTMASLYSQGTIGTYYAVTSTEIYTGLETLQALLDSLLN